MFSRFDKITACDGRTDGIATYYVNQSRAVRIHSRIREAIDNDGRTTTKRLHTPVGELARSMLSFKVG